MLGTMKLTSRPNGDFNGKQGKRFLQYDNVLIGFIQCVRAFSNNFHAKLSNLNRVRSARVSVGIFPQAPDDKEQSQDKEDSPHRETGH